MAFYRKPSAIIPNYRQFAGMLGIEDQKIHTELLKNGRKPMFDINEFLILPDPVLQSLKENAEGLWLRGTRAAFNEEGRSCTFIGSEPCRILHKAYTCGAGCKAARSPRTF